VLELGFREGCETSSLPMTVSSNGAPGLRVRRTRLDELDRLYEVTLGCIDDPLVVTGSFPCGNVKNRREV
jgi:hypothetical protein